MRSEKQKSLAKTKCGRLYRKFHNRQFILDDESYFTLSHSGIGGNGEFYTADVSKESADVKFYKKAKFEQKLLVWLAIGPMGVVSTQQASHQEVWLRYRRKTILERVHSSPFDSLH